MSANPDESKKDGAPQQESAAEDVRPSTLKVAQIQPDQQALHLKSLQDGVIIPGDNDTSLLLTALTDLPIDPEETGKGGEGGAVAVTNAEFIAAVFPNLPGGAFEAVCSEAGNPERGGWAAKRADQFADNPETNNYVGCSSFYPCADASFKARKTQFAACHFLMLDDLGTKAPRGRLICFELSWLIETSPGSHEGGISLSESMADGTDVERLLDPLIESGLCDAGATEPLTRWARFPVPINGKMKHSNAAGTRFHCRLVNWRPAARYPAQEIVDRLELEFAPTGRPKKGAEFLHTLR